jgi:hypothetical protein
MTAPIVSLSIPDDVTARAQEQSLALIDQARQLRITNDSELAIASSLRSAAKAGLRQLDDDFKPVKQAWDNGKKSILALYRKYASPFNQAIEILDVLIRQYHSEVQRTQEREITKIRAGTQAELEKSAVEEAVTLIEQGEESSAQEILESLSLDQMSSSIASLTPIIRKPQVEGLSVRTLKRFKVIDVSLIKPEFMMPDTVKIQKCVTENGKRAEEIVGKGSIEYYEEKSVASRL